jgi:hypothetical protein
MDAAALIASLHGRLLRLTCAHQKQHFEGLAAAARSLHSNRIISCKLKNRLAKLDIVFGFTRHISEPFADALITELQDALVAQAADASVFSSVSSSTSTSAPTSSARSCCSSTVRNLLVEQDASRFDVFDDEDVIDAALLPPPRCLTPFAPFREADLRDAFLQLAVTVNEQVAALASDASVAASVGTPSDIILGSPDEPCAPLGDLRTMNYLLAWKDRCRGLLLAARCAEFDIAVELSLSYGITIDIPPLFFEPLFELDGDPMSELLTEWLAVCYPEVYRAASRLKPLGSLAIDI